MPDGQAVQPVELASAVYCPKGQLVQLDAFDTDEKVPTEQAEQLEDPVRAYWPGRQLTQLLAEGPEYRPEAQSPDAAESLVEAQ